MREYGFNFMYLDTQMAYINVMIPQFTIVCKLYDALDKPMYYLLFLLSVLNYEFVLIGTSNQGVLFNTVSIPRCSESSRTELVCQRG